MKNSTMELGSMIQGFKFTCQTEGKSSKTIEWYSNFLGRFHRFRVLDTDFWGERTSAHIAPTFQLE